MVADSEGYNLHIGLISYWEKKKCTGERASPESVCPSQCPINLNYNPHLGCVYWNPKYFHFKSQV